MLNNPIVKRESRTRWRGARAFLLMMAYAATLAIAMVWRYGNALPALEYSFLMDQDVQHASPLGRELFLSLSTLQMIGWMILAPALTATGLAGERERGLLEGVQLSRLSPVQILWGKMLSALSFIVLMMPVALPITATCFLLGGLAPHELTITTLLQLVTAANGASIGLFFSARSRRAQGALASAFIVTALWGLGSYMAFEQWQAGAWALGPTTEFLGWLWALGTAIIGWSSPIVATIDVIAPRSLRALNTLPFGDLFTYIPLWTVSIAVQLIGSAILLWLGTRSLRRPLPDLMISERRWTDPVRERYAQLMAASASRAVNARERASSRLARQAGNALLWELPLHKLIRFRNPVLQREVRGKFRWRSGSLATTVFQALFALIPAGLYVTLLYAAFSPPDRASTWWGVANIGLAVLMLACSVMGASSITREREGGTWEGLQLSLLPPREIIVAKFAAPLIACFYYSQPVLPVLIFYINYSFAPQSARAYGVPVLQAVATIFVLVGAGAFCTAWGLFISSVCTRTLPAVAWTLSTLLLAIVLFPIMFDDAPGIQNDMGGQALLWHPYAALEKVQWVHYYAAAAAAPDPVPGFWTGARYAACTAIASLCLLLAAVFILQRQMRNFGLARDTATPSGAEVPQAAG
jgi:ABC-type transport system involved in multi-copper enzyme maturation permease subunit